jgi:hypothetical protein
MSELAEERAPSERESSQREQGARPAPRLHSCTYRVFRFGGRPVISMPTTTLGRRAGLRRLQPTTPRRRLIRTGVAVASAVGLDRWLAREQGSPLPPEIDPAAAGWVAETLLNLGAAGDGLVVIWPPQPNRGRLYLHASDSHGRPVAFAKIGFDERNRRLLAREVAALDGLTREAPSTFRAPRVVATHEVAGHFVVVGEPLPDGAASPTVRRAVFPAAAVAEYAGPAQELTDVTTTSWWRSYQRHLTPDLTAFDAELERRTGAGARTARAHGDISAHNMAFAARRLWLLDWEESAPDAPVLADRLGFALSALSRRLSARPGDWRAHLRRGSSAWLEPAARVDLMLALAFRRARGFEDATHILRNWDRSVGWGV